MLLLKSESRSITVQICDISLAHLGCEKAQMSSLRSPPDKAVVMGGLVRYIQLACVIATNSSMAQSLSDTYPSTARGPLAADGIMVPCRRVDEGSRGAGGVSKQGGKEFITSVDADITEIEQNIIIDAPVRMID